MRRFATVFSVSAILATLAFFVFAGDRAPSEPTPEERMRAMNEFVDVVKDRAVDTTDNARVLRGESLNQAFVMLTGEAINPLFGVTALGMYNYLRTDDALRDRLPIYDQPIIWGPLLLVILLMLFNSTICETMPFLKIPLNALGDTVNKVGAVAVLPLVVKMFADTVAEPMLVEVARVSGYVFPVAHAGEASISGYAWMGLCWVVGAIVAAMTYGAVWMTFNVIDVMILICPFPGIDALLKSFRLGVIGVLAGTYQFSPGAAAFLAFFVVFVSLFVAGWSFRLSVFGWVFSTDILFFRRKTVDTAKAAAFSSTGMAGRHRLPLRTYGRLEMGDGGELLFSYRPWLVFSRRTLPIGPSGDFSCGVGLINPFLVADSEPDTPWLRLPPRYRGSDDALAKAFDLRRVVSCGIAGSLRGWLKGQVGGNVTTG